MITALVATVGGASVSVAEVDARESALRASGVASALPRPETSEGRQLRRWLTQLIVTERVVAREAVARGLTADDAPSVSDLVPDTVAKMELGSIAAEVLRDPLARSLFETITAEVEVDEATARAYHARNPGRFGRVTESSDGWRRRARETAFDDVREVIVTYLVGAARRRTFRRWLDARCAELVHLAPGYEHPGDPRQPDNTHRH